MALTPLLFLAQIAASTIMSVRETVEGRMRRFYRVALIR
jgi:hypothetical protein